MENTLYQMIFKRKSFHIFKGTGEISSQELKEIEDKIRTLKPLVENINTEIKIVPAGETTCKRGQEYCILFYSEKKNNYLQNIGYIGQQLDLYLASMNIGALWFGIGKTEVMPCDGMEFVIMIAIARMPEEKFRKDMFKSKRKPLEEVWHGEHYRSVGDIARFAPSACNTQPWLVEAVRDELRVYRYKKPGKRGIMPAVKVAYYNRIDIGIFLLFLELCLENEETGFDRTLLTDSGDADVEKAPVAVYKLSGS